MRSSRLRRMVRCRLCKSGRAFERSYLAHNIDFADVAMYTDDFTQVNDCEDSDITELIFGRKAVANKREQRAGAKKSSGDGTTGRPDSATLVNSPGGIDLNTSNGMQWKDSRDGRGVEMTIDPAMIARVRQEGVNWLSRQSFLKLHRSPVRGL